MESVGSDFTHIRAGEITQATRGLHEGSSLISHEKARSVLVILVLETGLGVGVT